MNVTAEVQFDRAYYSKYYSAWIKYRSRWRRWAIPIALVLLLGSIAVALIWIRLWPYTAILIAIAASNCLDAVSYRWRWIRKRLQARTKEKQLRITFGENDTTIESASATTKARYVAWSELTLTEDGIFLVPEKGYSFFVPNTAFHSEKEFQQTVQFLTQKLASL